MSAKQPRPVVRFRKMFTTTVGKQYMQFYMILSDGSKIDCNILNKEEFGAMPQYTRKQAKELAVEYLLAKANAIGKKSSYK
jgi:hypothetical protein